MKDLFALFLALISSVGLFAQLPDGSIAPDWTITDLDGGTHNLYDVLEADKSVIIDFSATWCPNCWNYHQTGILENMYTQYGPNGTVNANQIEVYFIEADDSTNDACMTNSPGCTGGTTGDWTAGTTHPMANPVTEEIRAAYQTSSYPTLFAICPNKKLYEVGQASQATWESWMLQTCALDSDFLVNDEQCAGENSGSIDLTPEGGAGTLSFSWSNGTNAEDLLNVAQGSYSCTITEGRGHSIEIGPFTVGGPATAVEAATEQVSSVLCHGEATGSISVTGGGGTGSYNYAWNNGETTQEISSLEAGNYILTITDNSGCTFEESYTIEEPTELTGVYTPTSSTCGQANGSLAISSGGGVGPFTYILGSMSNNTGVFEDLIAGPYQAEIVDANNCSINSMILIEDIHSPVATAVATGIITCAVPELSLNGEGSTQGGMIAYSWTTTDGMIVSGGNTLNPIVSAAGTYLLEVLDNATGCIETATVSVIDNLEQPVAISNDEETIDCINAVAILDGTGSAVGNNYVYQWSTENGNITGDPTALVAEANAGGLYTLLVVDTNNGCSASSSVLVNQTAELPIADAGEGTAITCSVLEIVLNGSESSSGDDYTYTWSTDDGNILMGGDTPTPTVDAIGTYLLEVLNTTNGCSALSSVIISLDQLVPEIIIAEAETLTCLVTELDLNVEVDLMEYSTSWVTDNGNIVSGENTNTPTIDSPGEYIVTVLNEVNGCSTTEMILIEELINNPIANYNYTNDEKEFVFADNSAGSPTTYMWTFGDGSTSSEASPTHEYQDNGTYEVCLTITNECGDNTTCKSIVVSAGSSLIYDLTTNNASCNAICDGIYNLNPAEAVENYTTEVTGPGGFTSVEFELEGLCAGEYTFTLYNELGESVEGTFMIEEPTAINVVSSEVNDVSCFEGGNGAILVDLGGGTGDISVIWNTGVMGNEIDDLIGGSYSASATDANGCIEIFDFEVKEPTELSLASSEITNIDDITPTGSIDIEIDGATPGYSYLWSSGQETEDITDLGEGEYTVIVTDANGCSEEFGIFNVQSLVAVVEIESLNKFILSPNPATETVQIILDFELLTIANIEVINRLGQRVSRETVSGKTLSYIQDISSLAAGLYFIRVTVENQSSIRKLIVE